MGLLGFLGFLSFCNNSSNNSHHSSYNHIAPSEDYYHEEDHFCDCSHDDSFDCDGDCDCF